MGINIKKSIYIATAFLCLNSCTTPSEKFSRVATELKYRQQVIDTAIFSHRVFANTAVEQHKESTTIHVYLDGDGTPWKNNRWLAKDPTSRNPMILRLMQLDKSPAILLGRPCYHGLNLTSECASRYWTTHRYSSLVVKSMAMALTQWLKEREYNQLILIGYSGGGVLAMLLASEMPMLQTVVTLAANLDVREWSLYHGYMPLDDSLNPAALELNSNIHQLHIAGADDKVVPTYIIEQYAARQVNASYLLFPDQNHRCCWTKVWPDILTLF